MKYNYIFWLRLSTDRQVNYMNPKNIIRYKKELNQLNLVLTRAIEIEM